MKTEIVQIGHLSSDDLVALEKANIIPKGTPESQVQIFATICKEKGLSPFQKQIYLLPFKKKEGQNWVTHYSPIVGIDGYRAIAEKTGCYAGNDDYTFNNGQSEFQCRKDGQNNPITATATVYKMVGNNRVGFTATASWDSYLPAENKRMKWNQMPFHMLGKCAEALALRKAFPLNFSGLNADVEIGAMEEIKDPKLLEQMEKSREILSDYKILIDQFEKHTELKEKSKAYLDDGIKAGMNADDCKELEQYINAKYLELKPKSEEK